MNNTKLHIVALAAISAIATSSQAVDLRFTGMNLSNAETGHIVIDGHAEDVYIGKINFSTSVGNLTTLCVDLLAPLNGSNHEYSVGMTDGSGNTGLDKAGRIVAANFALANTADQQAGIQLAVWSALYDGGANFNANGSHFKASNVTSGALSFATSFYSASHNGSGSAKLYSTTSEGGQSQITAQAVPEPISMGVLVTGAVGLIRRRRKS